MSKHSGNDEPTWDDMMEDTDRAVKALDGIYDRCRHVADAIRNGGGNLEDLERLLNQSVPVTEEDRRLTFMMTFLARIKRGSLIEYLFKIHRACLLLLIDGRAAATALMVENVLDITLDAQGQFHVARFGAAGARDREAARPEGLTPRGPRADGEPGRSRRRGGRRKRGQKGGDDRPSEPPAEARRAPPGGGGRPVMNMVQCHQVLASLDSEPPAPVAAASARDAPYLAAVVQGAAPRRAAGPAAPAGQTEPEARDSVPEWPAPGAPALEVAVLEALEAPGTPAPGTPALEAPDTPAPDTPAPEEEVLATIVPAKIVWSGSWADDVDEDYVIPKPLASPETGARVPRAAGRAAPPVRSWHSGKEKERDRR